MRNKLRVFKRRYLKDQDTRSRALRRLARHPILVPILTILSLGIVTSVGFLVINGGHAKFKPMSSYIVILSHDHLVQTVPTREPTVGQFLAKVGITLGPGDVVEPSATTAINQDNFRVNVHRALPVEIVDGSNKTFAFSAALTPRSIAQQAGVTVYPEDYISLQPTQNFIIQAAIGEQIVINRATPVEINLYGTPITLRTHSTTVGQLLKEKNINLAKGDTVLPADLSSPIGPAQQIFVIRNGTKLASVTQAIPTTVQTIDDSSLTFGTTAIRQQGSDGQEVLTYQQDLQNGQVVSQTLIQTVVTQQPVPEIIARGKAVQIPSDIEAVMAQAGISSGDFAYVNYIVSNESGWCPTKLQGQIGYCPGYAPASMPGYLGYGLGQATPGSKMAAFGGDWQTNPVTQLIWASSYASRYGGWAGSYNFWYSHHYW